MLPLALVDLDWFVIALYAAVVVGIGVWAQRRHRSTEDYFLGGRRLRWWAVGVSIVATSFSSMALIAYTGEGFTSGMGYLRIQVGDLLGFGLAVFVFLPFFARLGSTTAYEYLEHRFGVAARAVASALFIGQTLMRAGLLVLVPALALSTILEIDLPWAIAASGLAAVLYSTAGGITAVVWTDLVQLVVVAVGVVFCVALAAGDVPGGLTAVWQHADSTGRFHEGNMDLNFKEPLTPLWVLFAYGTLALSLAGTGQQAVQRYLSCRDLRSARRAAFLGWGIGFAAMALTLFLGVTLAAWSALAPEGATLAGAGDRALPLFIMHRLPPGIAGLLVAAVFAASMSSLDSAIHSISTATLVDFVRRFRAKALEPRLELRLARCLTFVCGIVATGLAILAADSGDQLLRTLINWLGYFAGPLLGLFVLGVFVPRATEVGALVGVTLGGGLVACCVWQGVPAALGFNALWLAPAALLTTVGVGSAASLLTAPPSEEQLSGLTWPDRR